MNPNEMTFDECRFYLLPFKEPGFRRSNNSNGLCVKEVTSESDDEPRYCYAHIDSLFPPTLDTIAAAMPKGWVWMRGMWDGRPQWVATRAGTPWVQGVSVPDTDDEKLDRARLAVACRMAERGSK